MGYKLLSDAILDGAKLAGQAKGSYVSPDGERTCALGAAIHAITGKACGDTISLGPRFGVILSQCESCPVEGCKYDASSDYRYELESVIPHLNDVHEWSRERIAAFVATIEEKLGLCEIVSDESQATGEARAFSEVSGLVPA